MANNALIEQAINDLISQDTFNVRETARKYDLVYFTFFRRYNGRIISTVKTVRNQAYSTVGRALGALSLKGIA